MEHIETRYEATLRGSDGSEYMKVPTRWDGVYKLGKEIWAKFYSTYCTLEFFDIGKDKDYYKLGFYKVVKLERVDIFEERELVIHYR